MILRMFVNPTTSQAWMFLPLVVYHAGGEEAQFEPLIDNIKVHILRMFFTRQGWHTILYHEKKLDYNKTSPFYKHFEQLFTG